MVILRISPRLSRLCCTPARYCTTYRVLLPLRRTPKPGRSSSHTNSSFLPLGKVNDATAVLSSFMENLPCCFPPPISLPHRIGKQMGSNLLLPGAVRSGRLSRAGWENQRKNNAYAVSCTLLREAGTG